MLGAYREEQGGPRGAGSEVGAEVIGGGQIILGLTDYYKDMAIYSE